jgi:hypothetical protein
MRVFTRNSLVENNLRLFCFLSRNSLFWERSKYDKTIQRASNETDSSQFHLEYFVYFVS